MPNSRQKILNYIHEQQSATVEELSRVFRVTPANIRHHMSILMEQGSVRIIGQRAAAIKGRPAQIYGSEQQRDRSDLEPISKALLSTLFLNSGSDEKEKWIKDIAHLLASEFKIDSPNQTRKVYAAIRSLNRMNYQAHWEAHAENPRVILGHCPYQSILTSHPDLCQLDVSLLEYLLDAPVKQIDKLRNNIKCLPECIFLIG